MTKKYIKTILTIMLICFSFINAYTQTISGNVYEITSDKKKNPLPGTNVFWLGTIKGTTTDNNGHSTLSKKDITNFKLVICFLGYISDTVIINPNEANLDIQLSTDKKELNEVIIKGDLGNNYISKLNPRQVQVLTTGELYRAACCNLSESFETNASVDVSYSDAITGAKQIQLLGLSGIYSQIQTENIPSVRGMASSYGLNYIPGSWM